MKMKKLILAAAVSAAGMSSAIPSFAATNLLIDGNFESAPLVGPSGTKQTVYAGQTYIPGWTVGGTSVDVLRNTYFNNHTLGNSIDLLGSPGPGSISQTFNAIMNMRYRLDFDLFPSPRVPMDTNYNLLVTFGTNTKKFDGSSTALLTAPASYHLFFNATKTALTTVMFESANVVKSTGPLIDNVSVTAIPEPETYALMLAGIGFVGFMARRRKQQQNQQIGQFAIA